jgi:hypothetical protein
MLSSLRIAALLAASSLTVGVLGGMPPEIARRELAGREAAGASASMHNLEGRDTPRRFYNNKTQGQLDLLLSELSLLSVPRSQFSTEYFVESLPEMNFDLGELYSGVIPVDMKNTSRGLFYVFQPRAGAPVDEITIWLNGGPGEVGMPCRATMADSDRLQLSRRLPSGER